MQICMRKFSRISNSFRCVKIRCTGTFLHYVALRNLLVYNQEV